MLGVSIVLSELFKVRVNNVSCFGSYGTAKSGVGVSAMAVLRPDLMMKCVVPVVMAGIIGVCSSFCSDFFSQRVLNGRARVDLRSSRLSPHCW